MKLLSKLPRNFYVLKPMELLQGETPLDPDWALRRIGEMNRLWARVADLDRIKAMLCGEMRREMEFWRVFVGKPEYRRTVEQYECAKRGWEELLNSLTRK